MNLHLIVPLEIISKEKTLNPGRQNLIDVIFVEQTVIFISGYQGDVGNLGVKGHGTPLLAIGKR